MHSITWKLVSVLLSVTSYFFGANDKKPGKQLAPTIATMKMLIFRRKISTASGRNEQHSRRRVPRKSAGTRVKLLQLQAASVKGSKFSLHWQCLRINHRHKRIYRLLIGMACLPCFVSVVMSPATA
jgi:hypothetical protein